MYINIKQKPGEGGVGDVIDPRERWDLLLLWYPKKYHFFFFTGEESD